MVGGGTGGPPERVETGMGTQLPVVSGREAAKAFESWADYQERRHGKTS